MKLSTKFSIIIGLVLALSMITGITAIAGNLGAARTMERVITDNLASVRAAEELEIALLREQSGITAYLLDNGSKEWLGEISSAEDDFSKWFSEARKTAHTAEEHGLLSRIEALYANYSTERDKVIGDYQGNTDVSEKSQVFDDLSLLYQQLYQLSEDYIAANERYVQEAQSKGRNQVRWVTTIVAVCLALVSLGGAALLALFYRSILLPLRTAIKQAKTLAKVKEAAPGDDSELRSIGDYLNRLMNSISGEFAQQQHELMESERKIALTGRLAASVAHEIRNPLGSIALALSRLSSSVQGEEEKLCLQLAKEEIDRLNKIVRHFLEFSRPPLTSLREENLAAIAAKTVDFLRPEVEAHGIRMTIEERSSLRPVLADAEQLRQVLINLLRNSMEATPEGGEIRMIISVEGQDDVSFAVLRIADTGHGIPENAQARLFEPFFTSKQRGTGLGLSIAARIIEQHKGALRLESSGPGGTTFALWLRFADR